MDDLVVVTGASSNHASCCANLLYSLRLFEPRTRVIVYDLGLTEEERERLKPERLFDRWGDPEHMTMRSYAWKPLIVDEVMRETGGPVLWLDAGDLVHTPLGRVRRALLERGFYSPTSSGTIEEYTHPQTLARLGVTAEERRRRNRNAAIVGFTAARRDMLQVWADLALDGPTIAPAGATTKPPRPHRFDQAVLSILALRYPIELIDERLGLSTHNDKRTRAEVEQLLCSSG